METPIHASSEGLRGRFLVDLKVAIHVAACLVYRLRNGGRLPFEGEVTDGDVFRVDIPPVEYRFLSEDPEGNAVIESDFITSVRFDVDNEWFETSDHEEVEYEDLGIDNLLRILRTLEDTLNDKCKENRNFSAK